MRISGSLKREEGVSLKMMIKNQLRSLLRKSINLKGERKNG